MTGTSPAPSDVDAAASSTATPDAHGSSSEPQGDSREALLAAVESVLSPADDPAPAPASPAENGQESTPGSDPKPDTATTAQVDDTEVTADEPLPFNKHPRFRKLLGERDAYRADATNYRNLQAYLQQNGLTGKDALDGLQAAAVLKAALTGRMDPKEALKHWDEVRKQLAEAAGEELPEDIRAKVDDGRLDEESAQELARTRHDQRVAQRDAQARQAAQEQERLQAAQRTVVGAVEEWENAVRARDPDYDAKERLVKMATAGLRAARGAPRNAQEAVQLVEDAYAEVNKTFAPARPRETRPTPSSRGGSAPPSGARPVPKSALEAAELALSGSGGF